MRFVCALFLVLWSVAIPGSTVQYAARKDVATGAKAIVGFVTGDFNRDGKLDIAVTDAYAYTVTVYLGDGAGGFGTGISTLLNLPKSAGLGPLLAGDVNEDGILDLIEAPIGGDQSDVVLLGRGDGTFQQAATLPSTSSVIDGFLVDVNGDGHLDIIGETNPALGVSLGDGKGNFKAVSFDYGSLANGAYSFAGIAVGDFNRDNHLDILGGISGANTLRYFSGVGDGSFKTSVDTKTPVYYPAQSIATADFDADGRLDLLVGSPVIASISYGNGDGTFQLGANQVNTLALPQPSGDYPSNAIRPTVATADMDGDGTYDVIAADTSTNLVSVFLNTDGKGTFLQTKPDFIAALGARSLIVRLADVNGDGLPDILISSQTTGAVQVFLSILPPKNTPSISFGSTSALAVAGQSTTVTVKIIGTGPVPTGKVTLLDGSTTVNQQSLDASGSATFTLSNLSAGQHSLTATYTGDKSYNSLSGGAFTLAATDFAVIASAPTQTVQAGGTASYSITITPNGAFTGTVAFTCSGLPSGYACSNSATTLVGVPTTAILTVSTTRSQQRSLVVNGAVCTLGMLLLTAALRRRKGYGALLLIALGCTLAAGVEGCGSGGSGTAGTSGPGTGTTTPTTPTTTSFTVNATGTQGSQTVVHTFQATLVVQ